MAKIGPLEEMPPKKTDFQAKFFRENAAKYTKKRRRTLFQSAIYATSHGLAWARWVSNES